MDTNNIKSIEYNNSKFIEATNLLGKQIAKDEIDEYKLKEFIKNMAYYCANQFFEEKKLIKKYEIYPEFSDKFIQDQNKFLDLISDICQNANKCEQTAIELFNIMLKWVEEHILCKEILLFSQIRSINSGKTPEEAYEICKNSIIDIKFANAFGSTFDFLLAENYNLKQEKNRLEELLSSKNNELANAKTDIDIITSLPNRQEALNYLDELLNSNISFQAMMIKYKNYHKILITRGIRQTKETLKFVAEILQLNVRNDDKIFCLGTGEFLIVCKNTNTTNSVELCKKILEKIKQNSQLKSILNFENIAIASIVSSYDFESSLEIIKDCNRKINNIGIDSVDLVF